jgi:uncharacterized protein with GYD domain
MATYILLASFTDQGIRKIKDSPKRADAFKDMAKKCGAAVKEVFWTLGEYDIVAVVEAPDDISITALGLSSGALGNIRTSVASAAAIPLAVAAASAGHRKGVTGTTAHRRCNRQTLATRPGTRGASVRRHEVHVLRWLTLRAALPISAGRPPHGSMMLPMGARKQRPARALRSRVAGGPTSHSRRWFRAHQAGRNPGCDAGEL